MRLTKEEQDAIRNILKSPSEDFLDLVQITGLEPGKDFRYADLRGISFGTADLNGYDFTGADLRESDFSQASIDGVVWTDADTRDCLWPVGKAPV